MKFTPKLKITNVTKTLDTVISVGACGAAIYRTIKFARAEFAKIEAKQKPINHD